MNDQTFTNKLILAPMAGVTDHTFRKLCIEQGADYTVSEMISCKALLYKDKKTAILAKITSDESPIALQIFGKEPEVMSQAAKMLANGSYEGCESTALPAAIDINMGCPVHKIVSNGEGSALMKDPVRVGEIVDAVVGASSIPVTVKIRAGFDAAHKNAPQIAQIAEKFGASAVCIHGRTREQMYRPGVDLDVIKEVKSAVKIPVIGNGDIYTGKDALKMKEYTGCDSLMIGRGSCGNPFIFSEIRCVFNGDRPYEVMTLTRLKTAKRHLELLVEDKGEYTGLMEARKHIAWYIKGIEGAPAIRDKINRISEAAELCDLLDMLIDEYTEND